MARQFRPIFLFAAFLFLINLSWSQNLSGGIIFGLNASQVDGDSDGGFRQVGPVLGGYVSYPLSDKLQLQPEIIFEQLGSVSKGRFFAIRTSHISVPVLLSYPIEIELEDGNRQLELQAGPVIGILLGAKDGVSGEDFSTTYRSTDIRAVAGGTYQIAERWKLSLRYGYSVISFLKTGTNPNILRPGAPGLYHHYVQLSFRYGLG